MGYLAERIAGGVARRPAVATAILLMSGIGAHRALPVWPWVWSILGVAAVVGARLTLRRAGLCSALLALATVLGGCASAQIAYWYFTPNDIGQFAGHGRELAWVEGRVEETPRWVEARGRGRPIADRQMFEVRVSSVLTWKGWAPAGGRLPVTASPPRPDLAAGQVVRLLGRLERPEPAMNPGGFDSAEFYRRERTLVTMRVTRPYDVQILESPRTWAWVGSLREKARGILDRGFTYGRSQDRATLRALVFGDREPALKPVSDDFSTTGTTHLLAANGMRVAMVAGLVYLVCRLLQVPPRRTVTVATVCVIAFGLVTMPVSQSIRPVIVCAAIGAALASRRVTDSVQMLALAAIAVLVIRPLDLYGAGFQLSFIIVLALILLTRPAIAFIASLEDEDRRVARSFAPRTRRRMRRERTRKWAVGFLVAAAVGWAAAVPLVAFHFEQFNLWTVPFTILLSPLAVLAIGAGFAKLILTAVCPPLAGAWAVMAAVPASWLGHAVAWLAKVPGADLPVGSPPLWVSIVFYAMLCLPLLQWVNKRARWWARCAPLGGLAALILVPVWTARVTEGPGPGGLKITLLGVGAGQCAVVETGGKTVVLDAGSSTFSDPYRSCIAPFLRHEGCVRVDELWLSHGDFDHVGAAQQLVAGYGVKEVLASPHLRRLSHESRPCQELLAELDQTKHSPRLVTKGDSIQVGPTTLEVLWPPPDSNFNTNNTGVVLKVACAGRSVLFPADIQDLAEKELLKHRELLTADVLVAPHHGSEERTTRQFVDAVHPRAIVSSNGETLSMKQRSFDADVRGVPSFRTSRYGAITIEVRADGAVRITSYREGRLLEIKR